MKTNYFNLTKEPETPRYFAYTIKKGVTTHYLPSFERGDTDTRKFAGNSKEALEFGGVSIAHSKAPDKASIIRAMSILQGLLSASVR